MGKSIKRQAFSSVIWKFLERIIAQGISLIVSIIIARILVPEDYAVVSIVTIFFAFANIIISGGLNTALIQKKDADSVDYSTVLNISVAGAAIIYIVLFFTAPFIADIYRQPLLVSVLRVMGLILPVSAVKSIWCAYISANLQFKKFFFATIIGTVISAFIGVYMAMKGFGAWALVAQQMSNTVIDTIVLIVSTRIGIKLVVSYERFIVLFRYGWKVLASSVLVTIYTEITPLLIGFRYNSSDLSFYTKGKSFPNLISATTTNTLSAVLFPVLSKYQDSKESLLRYTRFFMKMASFICFPLMIGFALVADDFVKIVLTEKWMPATPYIRIFCLICMFDMIHVGNCETIKAMGRSDVYLKMEIIKKSGYFLTIALFLLLTDSPIGLACSSIVCTMIAIVVNSIPNKRLIGYEFRMQIADLVPNLLTSLSMCIPVFIIKSLGISIIPALLLQIFTGGASFILAAYLLKNPCLIYSMDIIKKKRKTA